MFVKVDLNLIDKSVPKDIHTISIYKLDGKDDLFYKIYNIINENTNPKKRKKLYIYELDKLKIIYNPFIKIENNHYGVCLNEKTFITILIPQGKDKACLAKAFNINDEDNILNYVRNSKN